MSKNENNEASKRTKIPKRNNDTISWALIAVSVILKWFWLTAVLLGIKGFQVRKNRRLDAYRNCVNIIGDKASISIEKLAHTMGKSRSAVIKMLNEMIEKNYLGPEAFIDHSAGMLYIYRYAVNDAPHGKSHIEFDFSELSANLSDIFAGITGIAGDVARTLKREFAGSAKSKDDPSRYHNYAPSGSRPAEPEQPAAAEEAPARETEAAKPKDDAGRSDSEATLKKLRLLNDQILDDDVSRKIERIERLTGDIYAFVQLNPGRENEVRKFMNYYLPTTMKLLQSYAMLERQSYQGDNIIAARHDIEKILDTLVHAFERQLDQLFATDAVDISSDIQVLETMIASDGLDNEEKGYRLKL